MVRCRHCGWERSEGVGPHMQATMLVHFAAEDGEGLRPWTSFVDGPVAMEARAQW